MSGRSFSCVVIGVSAGGLEALISLLSRLPSDFPIPLAVVQHEKADSGDLLASLLNSRTELTVRTVEEKESLENGIVYICPADYHLLVEDNRTLSLSVEPKVNYARPSIDILFETAAEAYGKELIGIILTGASSDGAKGLATVIRYGGYSIVQDPETAYSRFMPDSAIKACPEVDKILSLEELPARLVELCMKGYSL